MRSYRNQQIEARAEERLAQLEQLLGRPLTPPIPIDLLAEKVLGLDFLWEPIDELPTETILGGLIADQRLIILNQKHQPLFEEKPGLERSTKGHEMGHFDLFVNRSRLGQPTLFPLDECACLYRNAPSGCVAVLEKLLADPEGQELLRRLNARADAPDEARAVNRYAAALAMPRRLITEAALAIDRTQWKNLYMLREQFAVTITALRVRLEQLDLLCVKGDELYESRDQANGQRTFDF